MADTTEERLARIEQKLEDIKELLGERIGAIEKAHNGLEKRLWGVALLLAGGLITFVVKFSAALAALVNVKGVQP